MSTPTTIKCFCGWRGRRVYQICEHDTPCSCSGFGKCPKCGWRVESVQRLREMAEWDRKTEAWLNSPEGKAELARIGGSHA
jgi:hypothetical protein